VKPVVSTFASGGSAASRSGCQWKGGRQASELGDAAADAKEPVLDVHAEHERSRQDRAAGLAGAAQSPNDEVIGLARVRSEERCLDVSKPTVVGEDDVSVAPGQRVPVEPVGHFETVGEVLELRVRGA
jgi:hypothetical protein